MGHTLPGSAERAGFGFFVFGPREARHAQYNQEHLCQAQIPLHAPAPFPYSPPSQRGNTAAPLIVSDEAEALASAAPFNQFKLTKASIDLHNFVSGLTALARTYDK
jgi:hypothetical protein